MLVLWPKAQVYFNYLQLNLYRLNINKFIIVFGMLNLTLLLF